MKKALLTLFAIPLLFPFPSAAATKVDLPVPFVWEIPDGIWVKPWSGACEEASVIMVENYYLNKRGVLSRSQMKSAMLPLFGIQDKLFGSNLDTNSTRTLKLINDYTSFDASIVINPTIEEIKAELDAARPVISLHYGYGLKNPKHRFSRTGSSYHVMVLTGYDDAKKLFFANDTEMHDGIDFPYSYATIMSSLSDFNHTTKAASGKPTVLFTKPKMLVRRAGGHRTYLVRDGVKHYISNLDVFKNHRLSWSMVKDISPEELDSFENGTPLNK